MQEKNNKLQTQEKMTIYDYEEKNVKRQNVKAIKFFVNFFMVVIGIVVLTCFFMIFKSIYDINEYAGYVAAAILILLFILLYIVPVIKIKSAKYFITNVNVSSAKQAKKHNLAVRNDIADKMIDFTSKVEGVGWYDSEIIGKLAIARNTNDNEKVKELLTTLYNGNVKKTAREIIISSSVKAGLYSAISQSQTLDTALVISLDLQLIKDLVFLYGFRPSDTYLMKIFAKVLRNALIAYGVGSVNIGNAVAKTISNMTKNIQILGSIISTVVDSSVQGIVNGTMTTIIGYETIKYLKKEYNLQNVLDGIDLGESEQDKQLTLEEVEKQLKTVGKNNKKKED